MSRYFLLFISFLSLSYSALADTRIFYNSGFFRGVVPDFTVVKFDRDGPDLPYDNSYTAVLKVNGVDVTASQVIFQGGATRAQTTITTSGNNPPGNVEASLTETWEVWCNSGPSHAWQVIGQFSKTSTNVLGQEPSGSSITADKVVDINTPFVDPGQALIVTHGLSKYAAPGTLLYTVSGGGPDGVLQEGPTSLASVSAGSLTSPSSMEKSKILTRSGKEVEGLTVTVWFNLPLGGFNIAIASGSGAFPAVDPVTKKTVVDISFGTLSPLPPEGDGLSPTPGQTNTGAMPGQPGVVPGVPTPTPSGAGVTGSAATPSAGGGSSTTPGPRTIVNNSNTTISGSANGATVQDLYSAFRSALIDAGQSGSGGGNGTAAGAGVAFKDGTFNDPTGELISAVDSSVAARNSLVADVRSKLAINPMSNLPVSLGDGPSSIEVFSIAGVNSSVNLSGPEATNLFRPIRACFLFVQSVAFAMGIVYTIRRYV